MQSWSSIWEKKKWYTWIVGHLLNQKKITPMSRKITLNCKFECTSVDKPSALDCGLVRGVVQIPTFAKLYIDTVGFIFIFCSCVIYRCLDTCKNNSHMFHFKLFALFWYCNTSNAARRTRGGRHPGERHSKTLCSLWKRSTQKSCVALLSWAQGVLHEMKE